MFDRHSYCWLMCLLSSMADKLNNSISWVSYLVKYFQYNTIITTLHIETHTDRHTNARTHKYA